MSGRLMSRILKRIAQPSTGTSSKMCLQCRYSTAPPAPPLLLKFRNDLKAAMKAKDTNRLNVVRGVLNEVTNSAKTQSPIKTDLQLLSLLRKRAAAAQTASKEFKDAGRSDLQEKEDSQIAILDEYAGGVETMSMSDIQDIVRKAIDEMESASAHVTMGDVSKRLFAPGGDFDGRSVEKSQVVKAVRELLGKA